MIQLKETAGDTLTGAIDGTNYAYGTSFDFNPDTVQVYVNGRLKIRDWDDGFVVIPPRTVHLKEPLLAGDSLEVEYQSPTNSGGGALGGVPGAPTAEVFQPGVSGEDLAPVFTSGDMRPSALVDTEPASLLAEDLRPVIITSSSTEE